MDAKSRSRSLGLTRLVVGTQYYYQVLVWNSDGLSSPSNEVAPSTAASTITPWQPDAVTLSAAQPVAADSVSLSWTQSQTAGFGWYELHRSATAGFTPSDATLVQYFTDATALSATDDSVSPATTYYYKLVVYNELGQSAASAAVAVTTAALPVPAAVQLSAAAALPTSVALTCEDWADPGMQHGKATGHQPG